MQNMKKNNTRRDFTKFAKRNTHKRRAKDAARRELEKIIEKTNVQASSAVLNSALDIGKSGYSPQRGSDLVAEGIFSSSKGGYGFVHIGEQRDIFISAGKSLHALDGDRVEIEYYMYRGRDGREKTEGRVKKILEYGRKTAVGMLSEELVLFSRRRRGYILVLIPDDPKVTERIRVEFTAGAVRGDKVEVNLKRGRETLGDVVRIFGDAQSFEANYEAHLAECGIETAFTEAALEEAKKVSGEEVSADGRVDRRGQIIFSIDGEGAKDLDDAVSVRKLSGGAWQLGVHIADVSHYVRERTPLDRAAMLRGTSVYFTDKVVPMLPEALSNGCCSLSADEDKYTISAIMNISKTGEILSVKLEPSLIRSRVRGVYSEINTIFSGKASSEVLKKYRAVLPTLDKMRELYGVLKEKSLARGALELDSSEAEILLDESGAPSAIIKRKRGEAEMMIEQFMLAANEAVARLLTEKGIPCVYRIHEPPPEDKLRELVTYAHNLGFDASLISMKMSSSADLSRLLKKAEERDLFIPVSYTMLRSMSKARYSEILSAHYGLGMSHYCHFTSPIRRLADLATHRIIHEVLFEGRSSQRYASYAKRAAAAASEAEIRAVNAERRIENMYKALFMSEHIGEEFSAVINSVTSFGIFAELDNTCEGFVPISELDGNFVFDEKNLSLRSARENFKLADKLRVKLQEADVMRGKLRFSVICKEKI